MIKRGLFSEKERTLFNRIEQEHELFKYKMLASPAGNIYDHCTKIRFYESVYEYFRYSETIEEEFLSACLKETHPVASLWNLYMEYEYLKIETWEDIEEVLRVLIRKQEMYSTPSE